jgi:hypothetical protein
VLISTGHLRDLFLSQGRDRKNLDSLPDGLNPYQARGYGRRDGIEGSRLFLGHERAIFLPLSYRENHLNKTHRLAPTVIR